ncbi:uncharacterized protein DUF4136 [Trinickia symbiotica]|uniref:DUF4136 domain-containing protein n=1 Tax=Trinickia symbiotica TaxID=863227 RepID=A0A2N7XAB3_9BURK|nr:DUF4136 domain-containing protein [Trinickia symbiotica]PMS38540.1 DUF4136 domain-containing protein [Trinickia symbiotica]PPK46526.1 uncharacterized protein DUF4136 [Trinickia symbiotica]
MHFSSEETVKSVCIMMCLVAAALTGCAVKSDVRASLSSSADLTADPRTYVLVHAPYPAADGVRAQYESVVAESLHRHGFVAAGADEARYRLSVSYETHEQSIEAGGGVCSAGGDCGDAGKGSNEDGESHEGPALLSWPWQHTFVHSLTLRFFERASGREIYKVSATNRDHEASPLVSLRYLVESALARLPYPTDGLWQVKLGGGKAGTPPTISKIR